MNTKYTNVRSYGDKAKKIVKFQENTEDTGLGDQKTKKEQMEEEGIINRDILEHKK